MVWAYIAAFARSFGGRGQLLPRDLLVAPDAIGHAHLVLEGVELVVGSSARRLVLIHGLTEGLT